MNIAVCEDNDNDRALLCDYIRKYMDRHGYSAKVFPFSDGESLLAAFPTGAFDLLFLDIILPGLSGMDTARKIRETDKYCPLMFITVSPDYMRESFSVQTLGYVIKPLDPKQMDAAMTVFYDTLEKNSRLIKVPSGRGDNTPIPVTKIEYIEVYNKTTLFHMHSSLIEARVSLEELETILGGEPFLRCHRSYIINMNHVKDIGDNDFLMVNGDAVPMRIKRRKELKLAVTGFLAGRSLRELRKEVMV